MTINIVKERKRLESIKEQLEVLKDKQREAETEKKLAMKKLMDDFGCGSIAEAQKLLEDLEEEMEELESTINKRSDKLIQEMKGEGIME